MQCNSIKLVLCSGSFIFNLVSYPPMGPKPNRRVRAKNKKQNLNPKLSVRVSAEHRQTYRFGSCFFSHQRNEHIGPEPHGRTGPKTLVKNMAGCACV